MDDNQFNYCIDSLILERLFEMYIVRESLMVKNYERRRILQRSLTHVRRDFKNEHADLCFAKLFQNHFLRLLRYFQISKFYDESFCVIALVFKEMLFLTKKFNRTDVSWSSDRR